MHVGRVRDGDPFEPEDRRRRRTDRVAGIGLTPAISSAGSSVMAAMKAEAMPMAAGPAAARSLGKRAVTAAASWSWRGTWTSGWIALYVWPALPMMRLHAAPAPARKAVVTLLLAVALVLAAAACGSSRADTVPSDHTASASCPSVRAAGWQRWANRVHMTVFCPTWLPIYIDGVIGGVGASVVDSPGRYLGFLGIYDLMFALVCWASFEYVVTE